MFLHPAPLARTTRELIDGVCDLRDYVSAVCDRLETSDREIQAFVPESGRRERLLKEAAVLQSAYSESELRPALYGVLLGVKDVYHVDGFSTGGGSKLDPQVLAGPEAACVGLLRRAGALILGKTVTTEFAYFEPGPTRNPHNTMHTPGGSSSGSAAAVAAGLCPLALGTQTIGSVIRPAAFCGVVGFKPSYGRIPTDGILYFSRSADHVGCFTQDVEGMVLVAQILCHNWQQISVDYRPVLGIPKGKYLQQTSAEALQAFSSQLDLLRETGYTVKEVPILDNIETVALWHQKLVSAEIALEHAGLYARYSALYRPRTVDIIKEGQAISKADLDEARKRQRVFRENLEATMSEFGIDLWVTPAAPGPAPVGIDATGSPKMNLPWTNAGLPTVTVPAGRSVDGLPLGLQMIAPFMGDELLLSWAQDIAKSYEEYQAYNV